MLFVSDDLSGCAEPMRTTARPPPNARRASTSHARTTATRSVTGTAGSTSCARRWWCSRSIPRRPRGTCSPARSSARAAATAGGSATRATASRRRGRRTAAASSSPRRRMRNEAARADVYASLWQVGLDGGEPRRLTADEGDYSSPKFTRRRLGRCSRRCSRRPRSTSTSRAACASWTWPSLGDGSRADDRISTTQVAEFEICTGQCRRVFFLAEHARVTRAALRGAAQERRQCREVGQLDSGSYGELAVGGAGGFAAGRDGCGPAPRVPHEAGRVDLASGRWASLTSFQFTHHGRGARTAARSRSSGSPRSRGKRIQSFIVRPPGFDRTKKYPLFVVIHGGPHIDVAATSSCCAGTTTCSRAGLRGAADELQRLDRIRRGLRAAASRATRCRGPANEINEAADEAIRRYPFIDGSRQAAGGASYGGHLANWLAVSTDRYQRAREPRGPLRPQDAVDHERRRPIAASATSAARPGTVR